MYIRRTLIKNRNGKQYYSYRLVQSVRTSKGVSQQTILNLGTKFSIPKEQWSTLSTRIQEIIGGQQTLFAMAGEVERLAHNYAAQIIHAQHSQPEKIEAEYKDVDINSLEMIRPRSVSVEHVSKMAFDSLKLPELLKTLGFNGARLATATGTIIGRMCHPGSELATHYWLQNTSGLGELIEHNFEKTTLYQMYTIADQLLEHKKTIENHLYQQEKSIFGFKETITLYDLTNTYFEGGNKKNKNGKHGRSKEKRSDCPLVTLAMVLDGSGFPRRTQVFEGNISEPSTLEKMISELETKDDPGDLIKPAQATIVMDAGIASEENIKWLKANNYEYILVSRKKHREFDENESVVVKEDANCTVKIQRIVDDKNDEVLLYCHSTQREKKERAIMDQFTNRFVDAMTKLEAGLHKPGCLKNYDKVLEKIGRLKQQYSMAAKNYTIEVTKDEKNKNATSLVWKLITKPDTKDSHPGVYCLRTSLKHLDEATLWHTYTMLTDLEAVFRSLKSELGMRPVFHQITERITSHLFITVLAYHLVHRIRYQLKEKGITSSWDSLRNQLAGQSRITMTMQCRDNIVLHVRKSTRPEPRQQKIYFALDIKSFPGKTITTKINKTNKSSAIKTLKKS